MATVRILKTEISVTNINEVSEVLINEKKFIQQFVTQIL